MSTVQPARAALLCWGPRTGLAPARPRAVHRPCGSGREAQLARPQAGLTGWLPPPRPGAQSQPDACPAGEDSAAQPNLLSAVVSLTLTWARLAVSMRADNIAQDSAQQQSVQWGPLLCTQSNSVFRTKFIGWHVGLQGP